MKKILAVSWIILLCLSLLFYSILERPSNHSNDVSTASPDTAVKATTPLYFLNGQPVLHLIWDQLAEEFAGQTGIYFKTVSSAERLEGEKPVLFSVSGPDELGQWPCLDLSGTVAYANLTSSSFTMSKNGKVLGIASEAEPFGLIYNATLLARMGYTGGDINNFAQLKTVAQLITQQKKKLEFGAFSQPDTAGRFAALLSAAPEDPRSFWDLYSTNLADGTLSEGKAVFQLGTLTDLVRLSAGGKLQLQMLPLYTGIAQEENRGLACFGKHYWCIREDASQEEIASALAFLNFLVSPRLDGTVPVDDLGLLSPYRQATFSNNLVSQQLRQDIALGKTFTVCGTEPHPYLPYTQALLTYAADPTDENWIAVLMARNSMPSHTFDQ